MNQSLLNCGAGSPRLDGRSLHLRRLIVRVLRGGGRGHVGPSLSLVEILRVLYDSFLQHRPSEPEWSRRDRCILSKGHGCPALYAILSDHGYFSQDHLDTFCQYGSILGGHPERGKVPGVEASTGSLGHGLSIGVGMALAARLRKESYRVVVVMGDGEINEGSVWEAAMTAAKYRLDHLIAIIDYNKLQSYGPVAEVQPMEPLVDKWEAFGFRVTQVDGHDPEALSEVLKGVSLHPGRPHALICHTIKGCGISFAEHKPEWHHKSSLSQEVIDSMYAALERRVV